MVNTESESHHKTSLRLIFATRLGREWKKKKHEQEKEEKNSVNLLREFRILIV